MEKISLIDTETNFNNAVMSIGFLIADSHSYDILEKKYFIIVPEYQVGGIYSYSLLLKNIEAVLSSRGDAIKEILKYLHKHNVEKIFAYNACFDYGHLPELQHFDWRDIMGIAAYRQYNLMLPVNAEYCRTGRLKRGYGVDSIMRILSKKHNYFETHNALIDVIEELTIMRLLNIPIVQYPSL